jgi:hypothetical protein
MKDLTPADNIHKLIYLIRGQKVMLDEDLADLYGVETFNLNKAVKRNLERFPDDFMFQLTEEEWRNLKFQIGRSSLRSQIGRSSWGGRRHSPFVFTEQGVAMLSSVLKSKRAIRINIMIMRAFVRIRKMMSLNRALAKRLAAVERKLTGHDADISHVYRVIQDLARPARIGFKSVP